MSNRFFLSPRLLLPAMVVLTTGVAAVLGPYLWAARSQYLVTTVTDADPAPVALVLGAGVDPSGQPSPFLTDRLEVARQLYAAGKVRVVLVSGDNRTPDYNEPAAMRRWLTGHGVPDVRIVLDYAGRDTYDSCARAKRIFGVQQLIVVSQSYHVPRAVAICQALGLDVQGVGSDAGSKYAPAVWSSARKREVAANVKAAWDVLSRRDPVLGRPESGVTDALAEDG